MAAVRTIRIPFLLPKNRPSYERLIKHAFAIMNAKVLYYRSIVSFVEKEFSSTYRFHSRWQFFLLRALKRMADIGVLRKSSKSSLAFIWNSQRGPNRLRRMKGQVISTEQEHMTPPPMPSRSQRGIEKTLSFIGQPPSSLTIESSEADLDEWEQFSRRLVACKSLDDDGIKELAVEIIKNVQKEKEIIIMDRMIESAKEMLQVQRETLAEKRIRIVEKRKEIDEHDNFSSILDEMEELKLEIQEYEEMESQLQASIKDIETSITRSGEEAKTTKLIRDSLVKGVSASVLELKSQQKIMNTTIASTFTKLQDELELCKSKHVEQLFAEEMEANNILQQHLSNMETLKEQEDSLLKENMKFLSSLSMVREHVDGLQKLIIPLIQTNQV